jgi:focal adhesion kinase 1
VSTLLPTQLLLKNSIFLGTPTRQVIDYINNEACSNIGCPLNKPNGLMVGSIESKDSAPLGNSNSVWKIELRIRFIPKSLEAFLENDSELTKT